MDQTNSQDKKVNFLKNGMKPCTLTIKSVKVITSKYVSVALSHIRLMGAIIKLQHLSAGRTLRSENR